MRASRRVEICVQRNEKGRRAPASDPLALLSSSPAAADPSVALRGQASPFLMGLSFRYWARCGGRMQPSGRHTAAGRSACRDPRPAHSVQIGKAKPLALSRPAHSRLLGVRQDVSGGTEVRPAGPCVRRRSARRGADPRRSDCRRRRPCLRRRSLGRRRSEPWRRPRPPPRCVRPPEPRPPRFRR